MNFKEILKQIVECMPQNIQENPCFINIINVLNNKIKRIENGYNVVVSKDIFDNIKYARSIKHLYKTDKSEDTYFNIRITLGKDIFLLRLTREEEKYYIHFNVLEVSVKETLELVNLIKIKNEKTINIFEEIHKDDYDLFDSYESEIIKLDENYQVMDDEYKDKELDFIFKERFKCSIEEANIFRKDFKKYKRNINEIYLLNEMKQLDDSCLKCFVDLEGPYKLEEYINNFTKDIDEELSILYEEESNIKDNIYEEDNDIYEDLFNSELEEEKNNYLIYLKNMLNTFIKEDEEFIISKNLSLNIETFLYNYELKSIETSGIIIKKECTSYILYYLTIENDKITSIPKVLSKSEAQELYLNEFNNSYSLDEFFEINKTLTL